MRIGSSASSIACSPPWRSRPGSDFQILTKRADLMARYLMELGRAEEEVMLGRITHAVNAVLLGANRNWGQCGSTSSGITTMSRGTGAREPQMLRRTADGGVERLCWTNPEKWMRVSPEYAASIPEWWAHDREFGWGLKEWPSGERLDRILGRAADRSSTIAGST
jgi:hypothetical protein